MQITGHLLDIWVSLHHNTQESLRFKTVSLSYAEINLGSSIRWEGWFWEEMPDTWKACGILPDFYPQLVSNVKITLAEFQPGIDSFPYNKV